MPGVQYMRKEAIWCAKISQFAMLTFNDSLIMLCSISHFGSQ